MDEHFDYVVVGSGSAGAVVAARLSENPRTRVLLLEAGPSDRGMNVHIPAAFSKLFRGNLDWNYDTEPQPELAGRQVYWPRGKMLGGSSSMNAMMWVRGMAADYEEWGRLVGAGWGFDSVLNYLRRIENTDPATGMHQGRGGPMHVGRLSDPNPLTAAYLASCQNLGIPQSDAVNAAVADGMAETMVSIHRGRRWSTVDGYLKPAAGRRNLVIRTGSHATRILFDGHSADGVEYLRRQRRERVRADAEVILCGGSINTPQLLQLSGIGPGEHLAEFGIEVLADRQQVGKNLQDHLAAGYAARTAEPLTMYAAEHPKQLLRYLMQRRGMLSSNVAEAYGFVRSGPEEEHPDLELIFAPVPFVGEGLIDPPEHGVTAVTILLQPDSTGQISLGSPDPLSPPRIAPNYLGDSAGRDRIRMDAGLQLVERILATDPLASRLGTGLIQPEGELGDPETRRSALEDYSQTLYHPTSTCRMGADRESVVDPQLRVRGVERLRVADASVMPQVIRGHTNAPSIVIGERAADLIRGRTFQ